MFSELLKRADLANIEEFIVSGKPTTVFNDDKTNEERVRNAYSKINDYLIDNIKEECREKSVDDLYTAIYEIKIAHFELGLLSGIKLGAQLKKKMEEIQ